VLPVEEDIVEPGPHQGSDDGDHCHIDKLLGVFPPTPGLPLGKKDPEENGRGDQEAVPANPDRPDLNGDGAR